MVKQNKQQKDTPIKKSLLQNTKQALYQFAQMIGLQGRSKMTKAELVESLEKHENEVKPLLNQKITNTTAGKSAAVQKAKQDKIASESAVKNKAVPKEVHEPKPQDLATSSSHMEEPVHHPATEPAEIWHGETGPDMPVQYGRSMLHAMPRDPNWVYLYWEISDDHRNAVKNQRGDWIFETSTSMLRVYDADGNVYQEVPVLLDALCWYLSLPSSRHFLFEIGLKSGEEFIGLATSNKITLSQAEPSTVTDEEWAIMEERFAEMLQSAAIGKAGTHGASEKVMPHLVAERFRIPWDVPSLHDLPSSHSVSSHTLSSTTLQKK